MARVFIALGVEAGGGGGGGFDYFFTANPVPDAMNRVNYDNNGAVNNRG